MSSSPPWLKEPGLQQLFAATRQAGGELRVVGGAVRDHLLGREVSDLDLASSLRPEHTQEIAAQHGWKTIPTGLAHGTVTVMLPERAVEVTTLRRDVTTDGRHAVVAYTDNWQEDAARRDFTINAMSMDAQGKLYDYFHGENDLNSRAVRFIGDAATRIQEDGLRILRFFRFLASHGKPPADAQAITAIIALKQNIASLSGERIAAEMKKLLQQSDPIFALQQMRDCGIDKLLVNAEFDISGLKKFLKLDAHYEREPLMHLLALIKPLQRPEVATWVGERWKLSRAERELLSYWAAQVPSITPALVKEWLRKQPREVVNGRVLLNSDQSPQLTETLSLIREWKVPDFPVTSGHLLARGIPEGKALGEQLRALEAAWVASDYTLSMQALLAQLNGIGL